jgi:hypothetical protein
MSSASETTVPDTTSGPENSSEISDHHASPTSEKASYKTPPSGATMEEEIKYPEGLIFALIMASVLLSAFLVALVCVQAFVHLSDLCPAILPTVREEKLLEP